MFDNQTSMDLTACIFGLSTLLSSYQIYNVQNRIQVRNFQKHHYQEKYVLPQGGTVHVKLLNQRRDLERRHVGSANLDSSSMELIIMYNIKLTYIFVRILCFHGGIGGQPAAPGAVCGVRAHRAHGQGEGQGRGGGGGGDASDRQRREALPDHQLPRT